MPTSNALARRRLALAMEDPLPRLTTRAPALPRDRPPGDPAHNLHLMGIACAQRGYFDAGIEMMNEALALRPGKTEYLSDLGIAHNNLGLALRDMGRLDEAIAAYYRAIELQPGLAEVYLNLSATLHDLGDLDDAEAAGMHALRLDPNLTMALQNLAITDLSKGNYERGFSKLEDWRRLTDYTNDFIQAPRWAAQQRRWVAQYPRWDGSDLAGRTIALYCEHGFGDLFQFIRYASLLRQRRCRTVILCNDALVPVLRTVDGLDEVRPWSAGPVECACHIPLYSLPAILGTTLETIPRSVPYIHPDPTLAARWRERLAGIGGFRIGLVWQGTPKHESDPWRCRSIPLREFEPLSRVPGVTLVSLQVQHGVDQLRGVDFPIVDLGPALTETPGAFMDAAAVVANLDLVVTIDTGAAHLAGALGARTWVALPRAACWRWMLDREDSPWYPSMRLFRQRQPGDWGDVIGRMAVELSRNVAGLAAVLPKGGG
jgi:hypothetical protein